MMSAARLITSLASVPLLFVALSSGCGDDHAEDDGGNPALEDVVYEGGTNDEALEALLAPSPTDEPTKAAVITGPTDAALVAEPPPTFTWQVGASARRLPESRDGVPTLVPRTVHDDGLKMVLRAALGWVPEAHAHGEPISGRAYLLVFTSPSGETLVRAFTTQTSFTPGAAAWADLKASQGGFNAVVTWAEFESNRVLQGGGPWQGVSRSFTIAS